MNGRTFRPTVTLTLFVAGTMAQSALPDTLSHAKTMQQVIEGYNKITGDQSDILNGPQCYLLPEAYRGSPYLFGSPSFQPAVIRYNGTWYKGVPILCDAYAEALVRLSFTTVESFPVITPSTRRKRLFPD